MSSSTADSFSWRGIETRDLPSVPNWVELLGRAGHAAKGIVYFVMGVLSFKLAIGEGGETAGSRDAIRTIGDQPFGQVLLFLIAVGLLGYTAWRLVQAFMDTENAGTDGKGVVKRVGYAVSGVLYALLGFFAAKLALGESSQSSSGSMGASLLEDSTGRILLGVLATIVIGTALYFIYKGWVAKFMETYALRKMSEKERTVAYHAGRTGLISRGIAVLIVGGLIAMAAYRGTFDGEVSGFSEALSYLAQQSYGKFMLGAIGFGLMAYAVHMLLLARYRRFNTSH